MTTTSTALEALQAAARELAGVDDGSLPLTPRDVRLDEVARLAQTVERLGAELARRVRVVHTGDDTTVEHGSTTKGWLRSECGMASGDAATLLAGSRAEQAVPLLVQAWRDGRVVRRAVLATREGLLAVDDPQVREVLQQAVLDYLAGPGGTVDKVPLLLQQARAALQLEDPDARDRRLHEGRRLSLGQTIDGVWQLSGALTPEMGSRLKQVLDRLSTKQGPDDDRDASQRRHDALDTLARQHDSSCGGGTADGPGRDREPNSDAARDRVGVVVDAETLTEQLARHERARPGSLAALAQHRGVGPDLLDPDVLGGLSRLGGPQETPAGYARLGDGTLVGPATARRLACDAEILPAVLDGAGEVLDVGRATRTWPLAVRRAAWLRAGSTCEVSGCDSPHSDLHHRRWWSDGGPTALTNAVFLCGYHHHVVHHHPFDVTEDRGGFRLTRRRPAGADHGPAPAAPDDAAVEPRAARPPADTQAQPWPEAA